MRTLVLRKLTLIAVLACAIPASALAQNPELLLRPWTARWISAPGHSRTEYGVYHFRRALELAARPARYVVHVTADNRYQLFVNGRRVVWGPARGDLYHWRYETVDIAPHLKPGRNVLAAVVWNDGPHAAVSQVTHQTGFLLQGDTAAERAADTGPSWKSVRNDAYRPLLVKREEMPHYFVVPPAEQVDAAAYPWGWEQIDYDDSKWQAAAAERPGHPRDSSDSPNRWMLVPRPIPFMEEKPERLARVRQAAGVTPPSAFPARSTAFQVPANTSAKVLLDQTWLTTAYPELVVSGGKGARISLGYAEALWIPGTRDKGHRDEIEGKVFLGQRDLFIADGGRNRLYRPLWWRTWRYLELSVETRDEPITIEDLRGVYTGYPFERKARFEAGSPEIGRLLDTGWRTARLCAHETYMDCPYYEQLQYVGDARIQALVSLYMTGDARLMRNAIEQIDSSRTAEGATYSRAPSALQQYIPPFSLWWIGMVHDYWMYQDDPAFVRQMLPGMRAVLSFFAARQKTGGSLGPIPWWNFVDWVKNWRGGVPPAAEDGSSAPLDLQLLLAYQWAAQMEEALGSPALAAEFRETASRLRTAIRSLYWDEHRQLFADTPARKEFSQHTNALAVVAGLSEGAAARTLVERVLADTSLTQASIYFRFYLHTAVNRAGLGDRYLELLDEWRAMLGRGLTTWAEHADPVRSDCHAWGASPNYEIFRTILGIDSAAPGFRRVVVRPFLGKLERAAGAIPHPRGEIAVNLVRKGAGVEAEVILPAGVEGEFIWEGQRRALPAGKTRIVMP